MAYVKKEESEIVRFARGVIDLRSYAASAKPAADWLSGRMAPAFADADAVVTAIAPSGDGAVSSLPADEFLIVLSGILTMRHQGGTILVPTGRSAVLAAGTSFEWIASPATVVVIVACPGVPNSAARVVLINENAPLQPSNPPLAELLVGPTPTCRNHSDFRSANGEFACGTWDSTPYRRRAMTYRHIELMHLLDGSVTLENTAGSATFSRGDVFLVTRGAECAWTSTAHVKKVYAVHRPA